MGSSIGQAKVRPVSWDAFEKVEPFTGKSKATGRPFTKYTVVSKDGDKWTTFDTAVVADVEAAIRNGWPVRVADKINDKYPDQRDLVRLTVLDPRQPSLPGADEKY